MSGVLIALDGQKIKRAVLDAVFDYCRKMRFTVSVLLVNQGEGPSPVVADFLARLNQAGLLNGALQRRAGSFGQAVVAYARRHKGISMILVDSMKNWGSSVPARLLPPVGVFSSVTAT